MPSYMGRRSNYVVDAFNKVGEDGRVLKRVVAGFPVSLDAVTSYERIRGERYKCFLWALRIAMIGPLNDVRCPPLTVVRSKVSAQIESRSSGL